ncbi:LuxR family transcriptional regulator [Halomonas sp. ML-15]|uniref:helix-turn-helix transcriptional regulator n=1 Tax=Halomonas sp. ML-15 TaxID=2773305 RepID=UPI0017466474|nr:helix-turn-helix transcriptional regulator [Halomonas sp. ML-15]MBD3896714.1 LuxR family transcriptional regulator [Halomonas sp. ML-15]
MQPPRHPAKPPLSLAPVAKLAGLVRSPDFLDGLGEVLAAYFPGISHAVFHFSAQGRPTILAHNLDAMRHQRVLVPYVERMYLLDPIFQHWERHRASGVWSLDELAPSGFRDSDYFATYYRELGLHDEAGAFFPLTEQECLSLSFGFYRPSPTPAPEEVLAVLTYLFPLLESLIGQFWLASSLHMPNDDDQAPSQLQDFGRDVLSDREREVAWLILRGHSSPEIARQLGITQGTVKNHRKRLYTRLNISSQAELFRQFMLFQQPPA